MDSEKTPLTGAINNDDSSTLRMITSYFGPPKKPPSLDKKAPSSSSSSSSSSSAASSASSSSRTSTNRFRRIDPQQQQFSNDHRFRLEAILLTVFFGPLGLHLFYLKRIAVGVTYFLNAAVCAVAIAVMALATRPTGQNRTYLSAPQIIIVALGIAGIYLNAWMDLRKIGEFLEAANSMRPIHPKKWDLLRAHFSPVGLLGAQHYMLGNPLRGFIYTFTCGGLLILWIRDYFVHFRGLTDEQLGKLVVNQRSPTTTKVLFVLLGWAGVHHFYLRRYKFSFLLLCNYAINASAFLATYLSIGNPIFIILFAIFFITPYVLDGRRISQLVEEANVAIEIEYEDDVENLPTPGTLERSSFYIQNIKKKQTYDAWMLWCSPVGIFGGHLYYLGHNASALFYSLTAGFVLVMWTYDFFRMKSLVDTANEELDAKLKVVQNFVDTQSSGTNEMNDLMTLNIIDSSRLILGSRIGIGGSAEVFRGRWNGTEVAIKRLRFGFSELDETAQQDFKAECHMMSELRHPNILQFLGICLYPDICVVTEIMLSSLYDLIHEEIELSWDTKFNMMLQASRGMNYLHCHTPPIIHRDLKSPNLLVGENASTKVCDFGLSRVKDNMTKSMTTVGTTCWMAPELLLEERYSEKVDVYSMGVVLWEVATRAEPYEGIMPIQVITKLLTEDIRPNLNQIPEDCPRQYIDLMCDCWQKDPKLRPNFEAIIVTLEAIIQSNRKQ